MEFNMKNGTLWLWYSNGWQPGNIGKCQLKNEIKEIQEPIGQC